MSIKVMSHVWEHSQSKGTELLLLLAIADHAADDGYCWPNLETLAGKIRMATRTVRRCVKELEACGELYVMRSNHNNRYVVVAGRTPGEISEVLTDRGGDKLSQDTAMSSPKGHSYVLSEGTQLCPPNHHEPSMNHHATDARESFSVLANICKIDMKLITQRQRGMLNQTIKVLGERGITPADIEAFGRWWYASDWRGKTGQPPTPAQVRETWGQFEASGVGKGVLEVRV